MSLPFDPRLMPLEHLSVLPQVHEAQLHPDALRQRFASPPTWSPDAALDRYDMTPDVVPAAVLVPLLVRANLGNPPSVNVLLTQRTAHLRAHGGQISFPGGRAEAYDLDPVDTALREAHEEIGLPAERVEILGRLPVFVTGTGFSVTPVVGLIDASRDDTHALHLRPDPQEVDSVFEVPLSFLMNPAHHRKHRVQLGEHSFSYYAMPWPSADDERAHFIWGATAAMLRNLYHLLAA